MKKLLLTLLLALCCAAPSWANYLRGDVNGDGFVAPSDISDLVDYLLGSRNQVVYADANIDGEVAVSDISALIDYLLSGEWPEGICPEDGVFTVNGVSFTMIAVECGTFVMGATEEQGSHYSNETPVHHVTLSSYRIGQTEVTQELWMAVMGNNPSCFTSANGYIENLQRPVDRVSWDECQTFVSELNRLTGMNFRLPTEAEWEFAARGGNNSHHYVYPGSNVVGNVAWYYENSYNVGRDNPNFGTHSVYTKEPNELGLYGMGGNVSEWCQDWYDYYSSTAQTNPTGPETGFGRVLRGGSYGSAALHCRVSNRLYNLPSYKFDNNGFRLAL